MTSARDYEPEFIKGSIPAPSTVTMPVHIDNLGRLIDDPELIYHKAYPAKSSAANHRVALLEAVKRITELRMDINEDSFQIVTRKEPDGGYAVYAQYLPDDRKVNAA